MLIILLAAHKVGLLCWCFYLHTAVIIQRISPNPVQVDPD
jgi:hypothetical protein